MLQQQTIGRLDFAHAAQGVAHQRRAHETGNEAMQLARSKQYDFAVVDFQVPDMTAWNLLRQLRQGKKPIPHVAMTKAQRSLPEHVRAWFGGAEALLDSPPHPQRLNDWLRRL